MIESITWYRRENNTRKEQKQRIFVVQDVLREWSPTWKGQGKEAWGDRERRPWWREWEALNHTLEDQLECPAERLDFRGGKATWWGLLGTAQNPALPLSNSVIMDKLFNPSEPHFLHTTSHNSFSSLTVVRIKWNEAPRLLSAVLAHSKYQ